MKLFLMSLLMVAAPMARADVLDDYKSLATDLAQRTEGGAGVQDLTADTETLTSLGVQIMELYGQANPVCAAQFAEIKVELPNAATMSLGDVTSRFHNAQGLPTGPRHCYFGRGLVAHPLMNLARFRDGLRADERSEAVADFNEVAEHITQARQNIQNPPAN